MPSPPKNFKYIKDSSLTHRGFTNIYASARGQVMSALNRLPAHKTLFITGHSLGGALATLCAVDAAANTDHQSLMYLPTGPLVWEISILPRPSPSMFETAPHRQPVRRRNTCPPHIYKMPKREKKYYYSHVHTQWPLTFQNGSVSGNHVIGSYYAELAKLQPEFADRLSLTNPEFCPVGESPLEKV